MRVLDSIRLPYLPDWIKDSNLKKPEQRRKFMEDILAEALHRQQIYPGRVNDRTLSVTYTGKHYYLEEVRSDKLNLKSWMDWLYSKKCWNRYGVWVTRIIYTPKSERYLNGARFKLFKEEG